MHVKDSYINTPNYPIQVEKQSMSMTGITTRGMTSEKFKYNKTPQTCIGDATRLWNEAPISIRQAKSIQIAKKEAKKYCSTLPI